MNITHTVHCPIHDSFRVQQIAGMFDVPLSERAEETFSAEFPARDEDWTIGLLVGPSGSGKSTLARKVFGDCLYDQPEWPEDKAVIDGFGDLPVRQVTGLLTAVGFSSPPSWIKPYHVLSGGERFRCDLARALSVGLTVDADACPTAQRPLVVFDEFTSVVDRNVARIGSAAVAKAIRRGHLGSRFVAVSCHRDIAEWLEPDWVVDLAGGTLSRRRLRRPTIELAVVRAHHTAWSLFARHHYLSGSLSRAARCYLALWGEAPVAFCATLPLVAPRGTRPGRRISRLVTLPDYQGIGLGMRLAETVADLESDTEARFRVTASHPALIAHCQRSSHWRTANLMKTGSRGGGGRLKAYGGSRGRCVVTFEFKKSAGTR